MPSVTMIAGPNGSGKSTLIAHLQARGLLHGNCFNADDIARAAGGGNAAAQQAQAEVRMLRLNALHEGCDYAWETVMSHPSHVEHLRLARSRGYRVHIYYVATEDPLVNILRVRDRVSQGGHDVPVDRIRRRYHASIAGLADALDTADFAMIFDNSDRAFAFRHVGTLEDDVMILEEGVESTPRWLVPVLGRLPARMSVRFPRKGQTDR